MDARQLSKPPNIVSSKNLKTEISQINFTTIVHCWPPEKKNDVKIVKNLMSVIYNLKTVHIC